MSEESFASFDEWHKAHAKYMEPQDIVAWCRDAWDAGIKSKENQVEEKKVILVGANQLGRSSLAAALGSMSAKVVIAEKELPRPVRFDEQSYPETRQERRARERREAKQRSKK